MAASVQTGKLIASRTHSGAGTVRHWRVSVRRWWLDYCAREALRAADDRILLEAGCRRLDQGRIVPLNHGWPG